MKTIPVDSVESEGDGLLAFTFVVVFALLLVVLGLLFGKSHGHGGAALVVTQAQAQGAGKGAEVGLEPTIEALGQLVRIDPDEQVAQGGVAGDFAERGVFLARKAKPSALGLGEELGVSLNGGDVCHGRQTGPWR